MQNDTSHLPFHSCRIVKFLYQYSMAFSTAPSLNTFPLIFLYYSQHIFLREQQSQIRNLKPKNMFNIKIKCEKTLSVALIPKS